MLYPFIYDNSWISVSQQTICTGWSGQITYTKSKTGMCCGYFIYLRNLFKINKIKHLQKVLNLNFYMINTWIRTTSNKYVIIWFIFVSLTIHMLFLSLYDNVNYLSILNKLIESSKLTNFEKSRISVFQQTICKELG